jgi:hypothetical protein
LAATGYCKGRTIRKNKLIPWEAGPLKIISLYSQVTFIRGHIHHKLYSTKFLSVALSIKGKKQ